MDLYSPAGWRLFCKPSELVHSDHQVVESHQVREKPSDIRQPALDTAASACSNGGHGAAPRFGEPMTDHNLYFRSQLRRTLGTDGPKVSGEFLKEEARLYALPRLSPSESEVYFAELHPELDPATRHECLCQRDLTFYKFFPGGSADLEGLTFEGDLALPKSFQCSTKGGEHVRWQEDIQEKARRLRLTRSEFHMIMDRMTCEEAECDEICDTEQYWVRKRLP